MHARFKNPRRFLALLALIPSLTLQANPVLDWVALMLDAIRTDTTNPTLSSRNLAILNAATYDAVNAITRTHQPYFIQPATPSDTSMEAAIHAAGREVMLALYPSFRPRTDALFEAQRAALPQTAAVTNGLNLGRDVARKMVESRGADGANTDVPYIPSAAPGQWRRTPPFFRPPLSPQWRHVRPFCLPSLAPFLPVPPPSLQSAQYAEAFNEVKRLGGVNSTERTPEQTEIARFWSDFSYTVMPPGHWHEIASSVCRSRSLSIPDSARLLALLGMAQADAAILCWESKYRWNLWRPVTAIQRAAEDDNPATDPDAGWEQLLPAPPFPSYTSGHSTFSKASAQVLTHFFGTDAVEFTAKSDTLPNVTRSFKSLAACADEVGMSRIYGGIHYSFDNDEGKRTGALIGDYVSRNYLLPNGSLPQLRFEGYTNSLPVLRIHGHVGRPASLEFSPDLVHWQTLNTQPAVAGGRTVMATELFGTQPGFYRASEQQTE